MKVCVFGAGAIGGYLSTGLAQAPGVEVTLIARGPHLEAMRKNGLTLLIDGEKRVVDVSATDNPSELGEQDVVIVALKAHQAWCVAPLMTPLLGPGTSVVTCQNGVPWWYFYGLDSSYAGRRLTSVDPGNRQWDLIGPERAIGCVVYAATEIVAPGVIKHIFGDKFAIGEPAGEGSERCRALSQVLEAGGLKAPVLPKIRDEIWLKLWGNLCFNPISALTRATLDVVATDPATRALAAAMMEEARGVATRLGVHFRIELEQRIDGAARVGAHRTSMLQDLLNARPLEIDALVGAIQEMARIVGVETPYIDSVVGLVKQLGRSQGLYPVFPDSDASEGPPVVRQA